MAWCAYAKRVRDGKRERRGEGGRRARRDKSTATRGDRETAGAGARVGREESADAAVVAPRRAKTASAEASTASGAGFNPMMRVEVAEVHDERIDAKLAAEIRVKADKERLQAEREKAERERAEAKQAAEIAAKKAASEQSSKTAVANAAPTFRRNVAERRPVGWQPVRNEAADKLYSVIEARRIERRDRIAELTRLKREQARAAEAEAQLRAALERERRVEEEVAARERERVKEQARALKRAEEEAMHEEKRAQEQARARARAQEQAREIAEKQAREQARQREEAAREIEQARERALAAERKALEARAAETEKIAQENQRRLAEAAKKIKEEAAKEAKALERAREAQVVAREKELKAQEAARVKELKAQQRAEFFDDLKYRTADSLDNALGSVIDGARGVRRFFWRGETSSRPKAKVAPKPVKKAVVTPKKEVAKPAPKKPVVVAKPSKKVAEKTKTKAVVKAKPAAKKPAKSAKRGATSASQSVSWQMPRLPGALDAGGYATAGFVTSLALASVLSIGVRASRRKRARRRAERRARLESDKLKQKDRWAAAIDIDVVSEEVAKRAERVAESNVSTANPADADVTTLDERAALQRAYDEFLKASKADKKM